MNKSTLNGVLALTVRELICSFDKDAQPYEAQGNYLSKKREEVVLWCVELINKGADLSLLKRMDQHSLARYVEGYCIEHAEKFRKAGLKTAKELIWYIPNPEDCR